MPRVQHGAAALPAGTAICIGAFDGFHLGHQALLTCARSLVGQGGRVAVVTFDPHPATILAPHRVPHMVCSPLQRLRVLDHLEVDDLVLLPFDRELAALSPDAFLEQFVTGGLQPAAVVVGDDFRFGHRRGGDVSLLRRRLEEAGIPFQAVAQVPPPPTAHASELSSSAVRRALANGNVAAAAAMLGRWHAVGGTVVRGAGRGRALGIPTANVDPAGDLLPAPGIYATTFTVWDADSPHHGSVWPAASSLGTNPTFVEGDGSPLVLEAHVLDRDLGEALYGLDVSVSFVTRLRDEARYDGVDALLAQIQIDIEQTRDAVDAAAIQRTLRPRT